MVKTLQGHLMQKHGNSNQIGIVDYFQTRCTIQQVRHLLTIAMQDYEKLVFNDCPAPEHMEAGIILLDVLSTYKGWHGYLEHFWDEFERYVGEASRVITFDQLHAIYDEVVSREKRACADLFALHRKGKLIFSSGS